MQFLTSVYKVWRPRFSHVASNPPLEVVLDHWAEFDCCSSVTAEIQTGVLLGPHISALV